MQPVFKIGIVREVAGDHLIEEGDLGISQKNADLGPGQALAGAAQIGDAGIARQNFDRSIEASLPFQDAHEARLERQRSRP